MTRTAAVFVITFFMSLVQPAHFKKQLSLESLTVAAELEDNLDRHVISPWFPRAVDQELGGFKQGFGEDWKPAGTGRERSIVYQSRLTWFASQLALRYSRSDRSDGFLDLTRHGIRSLETLWDSENGGFFWGMDAASKVPERGGEKHAYGISFGIYATAAAHHATNDKSALELSLNAFKWLDKHAHDARNGGYYEALTREGKLIMDRQPHGPNDFIGARYGYKSMNSHIHLLEAFAELYKVSKNASVRKRLDEVLKSSATRSTWTPDASTSSSHQPGAPSPITTPTAMTSKLHTSFWKPPKPWENPKTRAQKKRDLVDHALEFGWDAQNGGFYDHGTAFGPPTNRQKIWWTQAEGLNALLLMHHLFGKETPRYWNAFLKQWQFIKEKQTDSKHGGWFPEVTPEGARIPGREKSNAWTDPYHQGRALLNCLSTLKRAPH